MSAHGMKAAAVDETPASIAGDVIFEASVASADHGLAALLTAVAVAPWTGVGWLRVTGEDRVRWLNGMLTNSIQTLTPGEGAYNFALSAQGRIQADATVFALADELRIETHRAEELLSHLDHFIIMDDVELMPLGTANDQAYRGLAVAGPEARALLSTVLPEADLDAAGMRLTRTLWEGHAVDLIHAYSPLIPRFELWMAQPHLAALRNTLEAAGAVRADDEALEDLRLLEGTPLYGVDIRDKELPQETAQPHQPSRALHFAKGCYLGQEIVERIRSRGSVHRALSGFLLTGALPPAGTPLLPHATAGSADQATRPAGKLTSIRRISLPRGVVQLALGYVRRETLERGEALEYPGGEARPVALPLAL